MDKRTMIKKIMQETKDAVTTQQLSVGDLVRQLAAAGYPKQRIYDVLLSLAENGHIVFYRGAIKWLDKTDPMF